MDKTDLLINTFQPIPPIGFPTSHKTTVFFSFCRSKILESCLIPFFHTPHQVSQQMLLALPSKNLTTCHTSTSTTLAQTTITSYLDYHNSILSACPNSALHVFTQVSKVRAVKCVYMLSHSMVSASLWSYGLWPARLLCPWDSPGKNTGVGCHFLLQGIFLTQGLNPCLLHCRWILYHWATGEALRATIFLLFPKSIPFFQNKKPTSHKIRLHLTAQSSGPFTLYLVYLLQPPHWLPNIP